MGLGRRLVVAWTAAVLVLISGTLYLGRSHLISLRPPAFLQGDASPPATPSHGVLSPADVADYVSEIMNPDNTKFPRLKCARPDLSRYEYLKPPPQPSAASESQYFFALDLRECLPLLPRLIGSVVEAIRFLGPEHCALSIIEGNSPDGTAEVLTELRAELDALTTTYYFRSSDLNPKEGDRIAKLATLRNMALQPMLDEAARYAEATVVFLNDVAICMEDILELVHQRRFLGADMTCGFDWTYVGPDPTFYDVWIARGLNGDSFFEIPADGNWNSAWNLFWNEPEAQARFYAHQPFQVFSCWNGATVFTGKPVVEKRVLFRAARDGECFQGEPQLFCKDMWFNGYGKIAVVPSVNLEYSDEKGKQIKDAKGYTSQWVSQNAASETKIEWQRSPPDQVKCIPSYSDQFWQAWNETL